VAGSKNADLNKARQAQSAALNKAYRAKAAALKKAGVLSARVNARKNITRATRTKINKNVDVLEGRVAVVRASKEVRQKYEGVLEVRGGLLVIPKERSKEKAKISRGMVEITRPMIGVEGLKFGEEREIILPFPLVTLPQVAERLKSDETLDGLKEPDEMFAFRLDKWASKIGFPDAAEMGEYILTNYAHIFKNDGSEKAVKYLSFLRYKAFGSSRASGRGEAGPKGTSHLPWYGEQGKKEGYGRVDATGRNSGNKGHSTGGRSRMSDKLRKREERRLAKLAKGRGR
jgi:hypothetical protein